MEKFAEYIRQQYRLVLSAYDQQTLEKAPPEHRDALQKKILRKYEIGASVLKQVETPRVKQTLQQLFEQPLQASLRSFSRLMDVIEWHRAEFLDNDLFDKYHREVMNKTHTHKTLVELINQAKDQSFSPAEFKDYLRSGLFEQGIYILRRAPSAQELEELRAKIEAEVYSKYQFSLRQRDTEFILNNRVQNKHIINQIIVPKYRIAREIIQLLGTNYLEQAIEEQLSRGLNDGIPALKRMKALAEWRSEGYFSDFLVRKFYYDLGQDVDELEALFQFMEMIVEYIAKDRAIHYMELGFYEIFQRSKFKELLEVEKCLYDIDDDLRDAVREYVRIMVTPNINKALITNGRVADCFQRLVKCVDAAFENATILKAERYLPKLQNCQNELVETFREASKKNPRLPANKPYKAIDFIMQAVRMIFTIESENLLRFSAQVAQVYQPKIEKLNFAGIPTVMGKETVVRFEQRLRDMQEIRGQTKDWLMSMSKLVPLEQTPLAELMRYVGGKKE